MNGKILLSFALLACALSCGCQQHFQYPINGQILQPGGAPAARVPVVLSVFGSQSDLSDSADGHILTMTDADGRFQEKLLWGEYAGLGGANVQEVPKVYLYTFEKPGTWRMTTITLNHEMQQATSFGTRRISLPPVTIPPSDSVAMK